MRPVQGDGWNLKLVDGMIFTLDVYRGVSNEPSVFLAYQDVVQVPAVFGLEPLMCARCWDFPAS